MADTRLTFFLMTEKGLQVLKSVVERFGTGVVDKVIGARDTSTENDYYREIAEFCRQEGVQFIDRKDPFEINTAYTVAISWRWLIPEGKSRLIVLHDSILPKYRGFAPLVNSLVNGEPAIGVTALFATDDYDRGDIIGQRSTAIEYPITIKQAIERVSRLYADLVTDVIAKMQGNQQLPAAPQNERDASYSIWLNDDDYYIDWNKDAAFIKRFIDAVGYPYRSACTHDGEKLCRITEAAELPDVKVENRHTGKVIFIKDGCPVVICGRGLLQIKAMKDEEGNQLLPLKKFRTRFSTK